MALTQLLSSMKNKDGEITIDGFHDEVVPLSDKDKAEIARVPFNKAILGANRLYRSRCIRYIAERIGARPTLDVKWYLGWIPGVGIKTVLPSKANAKIT